MDSEESVGYQDGYFRVTIDYLIPWPVLRCDMYCCLLPFHIRRLARYHLRAQLVPMDILIINDME